MPKISIRYGITIPGPKDYSSVRAEVGIELDADEDIDVQLKKCLDAAKKAEEPLEGALVQQVANLEGVALEGTGLATDFEALKVDVQKFVARMEKRTESIIGEVKRHKDTLEALDAAGLVKAKKGKKDKAPKEKPEEPAPAEEVPPAEETPPAEANG